VIRIVVADDHPLVSEGLVRLVEREADMRIVGKAESAQDLLELLERTPCDVLILDISFPDRSGLDLLKDLKALHPKTVVLVLSMYPEERFAVRAFRDGASGYVSKNAAPQELVRAIRKVHSGRRYVSERLADELARILGESGERAAHSKLSNREYQVLLLLARGSTTAEVAGKLHLSENTVQTYRRRVLKKLGLQNNVQLALYAIRHDLIE
jgi:two-component system invasion response regulator UvrY